MERNAPILARLMSLDISYAPEAESFANDERKIELGAADLPMKLCVAMNQNEKKFDYIRASGNYTVKSRWGIG